MGTKISRFRQILRGRSFSPTRFNSCQKAIQMDGMFGAGTAAQLSPEILGLNAIIFWTVWD